MHSVMLTREQIELLRNDARKHGMRTEEKYFDAVLDLIAAQELREFDMKIDGD